MKIRLLGAVLGIAAFTAASPASASGGLSCRTGAPGPVQIDLAFGHVFGTPLVSSRLLDSGRNIPVAHPQWWLDRNEVRLVLTGPDANREELRLIAGRKGAVYDGSIWRGGKRRWIRCREV
jgi:hypothetical protein